VPDILYIIHNCVSRYSLRLYLGTFVNYHDIKVIMGQKSLLSLLVLISASLSQTAIFSCHWNPLSFCTATIQIFQLQHCRIARLTTKHTYALSMSCLTSIMMPAESELATSASKEYWRTACSSLAGWPNRTTYTTQRP
jgi:hypothetical protein